MAVSVYSDGKTTLTSVLKELGILPGYYTEYGYWKQDLLCIYQMNKRSSDNGRAARKRNRRRRKAKEDENVLKEGVTYGPGVLV